MKKLFFNAVIAGVLLAGLGAESKPVPARLTVGTRTADGLIISRNNDLITFSQGGVAGNVSYPADAIKLAEFPIELDEVALDNLMDNRAYEEVIVMLEAAMRPFEQYSDLPSNLAPYQGMLMELNYKTGNFDQSLQYSARLSSDDRDPELQRSSIIYQGLALLESGRIDEAQALFDDQGWNAELENDAAAEDLYITAKFLLIKKDYVKAMETVAKVIAFHSQDPDWMQPAELLCAQIYAEMARAGQDPLYLDSADEVIREITLLYKDTDEADQAMKLKLEIDRLRSGMEAESDSADLFGR